MFSECAVISCPETLGCQPDPVVGDGGGGGMDDSQG